VRGGEHVTAPSQSGADLVLAPTRMEALLDALEVFRPNTRERGRACAAGGRVEGWAVDAESVTASVRGAETYSALWQWRDGVWECDCTCPSGAYCEHAFALACCVLAAAVGQGFKDPRLARFVGPGVLAAEPADQQSAQETVAPAPAPTQPTAAQAVEQLRASRFEWERESALDELLAGAPDPALSPYSPPLSEILEEPDGELRCWRIAQTIAQRTQGWLPAALEAYRKRPDLAGRFAGRERDALTRGLIGWAAQRSARPLRHLRVVLDLEPASAEAALVRVEVQATTPRLSNAPRTMPQLVQMRADARRDPGSFSPQQNELLEWLADNLVDPGFSGGAASQRFEATRLPALLERLVRAGVGFWSENVDAELARRGGIVPGTAVALAPQALRLLPACATRDAQPWLELRYVWPDGRERALAEALPIVPSAGWGQREAPMVLSDGAFHPLIEAPPVEILEGFAATGGVLLPEQERYALLNLLAARFPHVSESLAPHTRLHAVRAVIALDLRDDDWMQARLFAHDARVTWSPGDPLPAEGAVFEWTPHAGWIRLSAQQSNDAGARGYGDVRRAGDAEAETPGTAGAGELPPAEVWLEAPRQQDVDPAIEWLDSVPLLPPDLADVDRSTALSSADGWWMRASPTAMQRFALAWENRPPRLTFLGSERVRRLLSGQRRVRAKLRVTKSGIDWFAVTAALEAEGRTLTEDDLAQLRASNSRFVKLGGEWVSTDSAQDVEETRSLLADLGISTDAGEQRLTAWQIAGVSEQSLQHLTELGADPQTLEAVRQLRENVRSFAGVPETPLPRGLVGELREYQRQGVSFLAYTASLGLGAVLADDMGLGKTVQALTWLLTLIEADPEGGPVLVVCPASVVHVWEREAQRFAPGLKVLLVSSGKARHSSWKKVASYDLVITNYALLRRDAERWTKAKLRAVVLDEAQNIKNPDAAVTRVATGLRAPLRLALTGTPLENRPLDMWSIVTFLNRGYLGGRAEFQGRFDRPDRPEHAYRLLAAKLRPILLRRTKGQVAPELPPRIEELVDCELSKEQRQLYAAELLRSRDLLGELSAQPDGLRRNQVTVLAALTRLRQICCHPALAGGRPDLPSGKFDAVFDLLEPLLAEGHKVLLFSQFVRCLDLLAAEMRQRQIPLHMLTGSTVRRDEVVTAFQEDPEASVFLVSLKAGGTGLNLTSASYVILFDPWWNPAVEAQAIDRTHRIGQDRTVIAYRMLTRGTIEDKIWELQKRKARMVDDILNEGSFARAITREDLEFLLTDLG